MAWNEPAQTGDVIRVQFYWEDSTGAPLTTLSPAPVLQSVAPDGTITNSLALTQLGSSQYWYRDVTLTSAGVWTFQASCADTDCARVWTDAIAVPVGNLGVVSVFDGAAETQIDAIEAKAALIGNTTVTNTATQSGASITLIIGDAYLTAQSRQLTFSSLACPDLTTAGTTVAFRIDGTATGTVTVLSADSVSVQLTSAQTAALPPGANRYDLVATYTIPSVVTVIHRGTVSILS